MKCLQIIIIVFCSLGMFAQNTSINLPGGMAYTFGQNAININSSNTLIGSRVGEAITIGLENTFLGSEAGKLNKEGSRNTFIGVQAGSSNKEHSGSVMIGYQAGKNEERNDMLYISNSDTDAPLILGDFTSQQLIINRDLRVENFLQVRGEANIDQDLTVDGTINFTQYGGSGIAVLGVDDNGQIVKTKNTKNSFRFNRYEFNIETDLSGATLIQKGVQFEDGTVITGIKSHLMDNNTTGSTGILNTAFVGLYRKSKTDNSAFFETIFRIDGLDTPTNVFSEFTSTAVASSGSNVINNDQYIYLIQAWYCTDCGISEVVLMEN